MTAIQKTNFEMKSQKHQGPRDNSPLLRGVRIGAEKELIIILVNTIIPLRVLSGSCAHPAIR